MGATDDSDDEARHVGIAFAVTCGAGAATALGAAVVFVPSLVQYAKRKTLAGGLGLAAGVMVYVSLVEIAVKSQIAFQDSGMSHEQAYMYATLSFFGGVLLMQVLSFCESLLLRGEHYHGHSHEPVDHCWTAAAPAKETQATTKSSFSKSNVEEETAVKSTTTPCDCCSSPEDDSPVSNHVLEHIENMTLDIQVQNEPESKHHANEDKSYNLSSHSHEHNEHACCCVEAPPATRSDANTFPPYSAHWSDSKPQRVGTTPASDDTDSIQEESKKLLRMSINTALAIGLHNFPEGLATFVATLNEPKVGFVLALAIAIHNIPEGLCVAMPIYYATGKRWRAFGWGMVSGVSEPIAALLGYAVLAKLFSDVVYAVLFGMVSGMMVIISARELLPTAHRYDPQDQVVTYSFIAGMAVMALSLVLFLI